MAGLQSGRSRWLAIVGGMAVVGIGAWLVSGRPTKTEHTARLPTVAKGLGQQVAPPSERQPVRAPETSVAGLRISAGGRLFLDRAALPDEGPLRLALDLSDEARGSGGRAVRIVADDGRRIDATASPLHGLGSGVSLEIDPAFLSRGRYMIEVETADRHVLQVRRYVLEVE